MFFSRLKPMFFLIAYVVVFAHIHFCLTNFSLAIFNSVFLAATNCFFPMDESIKQLQPASYQSLLNATSEAGFTMASELLTCSLLRTLAATKPNGNFLELGTGTGLSTSWILDGMDKTSNLESIDYDESYLAIAQKFLGNDPRLQLTHSDGEAWVKKNQANKYDYIFADTWHGKYLLLNEVLNMLNPGGLYIIDDMLPQQNWPDGHAEKATQLLVDLENRNDLLLTKQNWASGIAIAVKRS
jgi:predicted O-methyltransferase YrrM